jgi:hypothetical protein
MEQFNFDKEDCRHYIGLLQTNINRMASNSANCKAWLVGIISATLALKFAFPGMSYIFLAAIIPLVLFYLLDSFYLGLEKRFILLENKFMGLLKTKEHFDIDIYDLDPQNMGSDCEYTWKGMKSYSTWPFYGVLCIMLIVLHFIFKLLCT